MTKGTTPRRARSAGMTSLSGLGSPELVSLAEAGYTSKTARQMGRPLRGLRTRRATQYLMAQQESLVLPAVQPCRSRRRMLTLVYLVSRPRVRGLVAYPPAAQE